MLIDIFRDGKFVNRYPSFKKSNHDTILEKGLFSN